MFEQFELYEDTLYLSEMTELEFLLLEGIDSLDKDFESFDRQYKTIKYGSISTVASNLGNKAINFLKSLLLFIKMVLLKLFNTIIDFLNPNSIKKIRTTMVGYIRDLEMQGAEDSWGSDSPYDFQKLHKYLSDIKNTARADSHHKSSRSDGMEAVEKSFMIKIPSPKNGYKKYVYQQSIRLLDAVVDVKEVMKYYKEYFKSQAIPQIEYINSNIKKITGIYDNKASVNVDKGLIELEMMVKEVSLNMKKIVPIMKFIIHVKSIKPGKVK